MGVKLFAWLGGPLLHLEGIFPSLSIADRREPGQVWLAGFVTASVFAALAGIGIVLKG